MIKTITCASNWPRNSPDLPYHDYEEFGTRLSGRDLSPDILATSVPISVESGGEKTEISLDESTLHLRSSSHNITGIGGHPLFALPIMSSDLTELLSETQADLRTRVSNQFVSSYQYRTTKWSFSIVVANTTMQYVSFQAVLARFIKLSSTATESDETVYTRVGVILKGSAPIADIIIMPCQIIKNTSYVPFANFGNHHTLSTTQPVEVMKVTPYGSTCAYELLNETSALAPYLVHDFSSEQNLTARSLETEILIRIGETAYRMSMNLLYDRGGLPREAALWAITSIITIGYTQVIFATTMELFDLWSLVGGDFREDWGFDTGFYVVGRLLARFTIRTIRTVHTGIHMYRMPRWAWKDIVEALLRPLKGMPARERAWAMEGEIYGPGNATSEARDVMARWQIWLGDYDEYL